VSEQDETRPSDPQDEVEAHKRRPGVAGEEQTEGESEDVEAHKKRSPMATDEPTAEGESDDDVELHKRISAK
jgi:hypothetical protein